MSITEIVETVSKFLLVPPYYTTLETSISTAMLVFAFVGYFGSKGAGLTRNFWLGFALIIIIGVSFLVYWLLLYERGGFFLSQTLCRAAFFFAVGALAGLSGEDKEDDKPENSDAARGDAADGV
jgi:hypothetical protein